MPVVSVPGALLVTGRPRRLRPLNTERIYMYITLPSVCLANISQVMFEPYGFVIDVKVAAEHVP